MNHIKLIAVGLIVLIALIGAAKAQRPYRLSEKEMKELLERIEKGAERFRSSLKNALEHSRFDDTKAEDDINHFVKEFESATDRLKDRFHDDRSAAGVVQDVLTRAARIDGFMSAHRLSGSTNSDWEALRTYLDELARAYNVTWSWAGVSDRPYRVNEDQLKGLLSRIEKHADAFKSSVKDALSKSRFDDTRAEDNVNHFIKEFEAATDRLKHRFNDKQSASEDAEEVLRRAARIDNFMRRHSHSLSGRANTDWAELRADLDQLALAYGVSWSWVNS